MSTYEIADEAKRKFGIPLLLMLVAAGLAGNYFRFPIFLNIDFLFGSIFAMLALQFFGRARGVLAAALIAASTYVLWNHPYAIIIMTAEVAVVGWLMERRRLGLVLSDTIYWLFVGMPLVFIFYHLVMQVPAGTSNITMTKQAVNGIANALFARLMFTGFSLGARSSLTSFREIIYNLLAFFVLFPALIMLALASRSDFEETDRHIRSALLQDNRRVAQRLEEWVTNRKSILLNLSEMAATHSPQQMQPYIEMAKKSDANFLRAGLLDRDATTTAYYPLIDELGQKNIGKNFADRPFIPRLQRTLQPMLTEVVMGRIGTPKPIVAMLAPVVVRGEYGGYVVGILGLEQIQEHFRKSVGVGSTLYTLLDKNGNVIMTNRADLTVMKPFARDKGTLVRLDDGVSQWLPAVSPNTPRSERWKKSFYVAETAIGDLAEWKLILEQPVAPFQKALYDSYTRKLTMLFLILLGALALAEFLSRRTIVTLDKLSKLTHELPARLASEGKTIDWPETAVVETNFLIKNFKKMGDSLTAQFNEVRMVNQSLERRVKERTAELQESEQKLSEILENVDTFIYLKDTQGRYLFANRRVRELFGVSMDEIVGQGDERFFDAETCVQIRHNDRQVLDAGLTLRTEETNRNLKDGQLATYQSVKLPLRNKAGEIYALCGVSTDITERKQMEELVRQMAFNDPLTKLPNRRLLNDRLNQTMAASQHSGCHGALMFLDLDNFKPLNDTHGHAVGDRLLCEVAHRLKACVREMDTVARFGGDEFVVMISELESDRSKSTAEAIGVAEKIRIRLSEPYLLTIQREGAAASTIEHQCTASIGIALFINHEASAESILKSADAAMYQAKAAGRNSIRVYGADV